MILSITTFDKMALSTQNSSYINQQKLIQTQNKILKRQCPNFATILHGVIPNAIIQSVIKASALAPQERVSIFKYERKF
jgi:hypothetical protein